MVEVSANLDHSASDLFTLPRPCLTSKFVLVAIPVFCCLLFIDRVLILISLLQSLIQVLPHVANDPCDLCHPEIGMLLLDKLIDIHSIEKEGAQGFLGRLGWNCGIVVERHLFTKLLLCTFSINGI